MIESVFVRRVVVGVVVVVIVVEIAEEKGGMIYATTRFDVGREEEWLARGFRKWWFSSLSYSNGEAERLCSFWNSVRAHG